MSPIAASFRGLSRVLGSPVLVIWLHLVNLLVALPLAAVMAGSIESSLEGSLVQESLRIGFDMGWYGEYEARAKGLERTLTPSVVGVGAFLDNLEAWLNGTLFGMFPGLVALGVLYAFLWSFFLGGILHRYGDDAGLFRFPEFFSQGATFFFRFARLALFAGVLYYVIYRLSAWLFGWIEEATRDVTVEETVLGYVAAASLFVAFLLTFVNMTFDYAKIATFRENRRSMLLATAKGFGFVLANLGRTLTLYYGLALVLAGLLALYAFMAPGAGQATSFGVLVAFLSGQAYLVAKLVLRLTFYASQMALYDAVVSGR
jgi:hypothetical protein